MSSIGAVGSNSMMTQGMGGRRRPDPAEMAEKLFAQLDTDGQGYIEQSDLQQALNKVGAAGESSSAASLFSQLDGNSDGKVTKDEFASALQAAAEQLDSQFANLRLQQGGMPPAPPPGNDAGFTKEELSSQLSEIGTSDSKRASLISNIVDNFDKADTDGDGKVSFKEAMVYDQGSSASAGGSTSATGSSSTAEDASLKLMQQIMRLMHAYNLDNGSTTSTIATSA